MNIQSSLPGDLKRGLQAAQADWKANEKLARLWAKDAALWTSDDEGKWLGWLDIVEREQSDIGTLTALSEDIKAAGFEYALLLGMGGSSLCPEVLSLTYGKQAGYPALHIVDSTDPAQVLAAQKAVDLRKTVCIVASKSGSTLEPNILKDYFFEQMKKRRGGGQGRQPLYRDHRSGQQDGAGGQGGRVQAYLLWRPHDWRTVFSAIEVRAGSGGCGRARSGTVFRLGCQAVSRLPRCRT